MMILTPGQQKQRGRLRSGFLSSVAAISLLLGSCLDLPAIAAPADPAAGEAALAQGDSATAIQILRPLAEAGDIQARIDLASLTLDDRDVGLKPDQAIAWLTQAADAGKGDAQARLGVAYAKGQHVTANDSTAYHLLDAACRNTLRNADAMTIARSNRDAVLARLTPAQRADALASRPLSAPQAMATNGEASQGDGQVTATALQTTSNNAASNTTPAAASPLDYRVQIGSLPSLAEAQAEWHRLQQKLPDLLGKRSGNVDDVTINGIGKRYRLTTGPFADRHAAKEFCAALKSAGQNCLVAQPLVP